MYISSLAHVLSISGYHMALVAGVVFFVLRACLALFPGLPDAKQRADVLVFLRTKNDNPPLLPKATAGGGEEKPAGEKPGGKAAAGGAEVLALIAAADPKQGEADAVPEPLRVGLHSGLEAAPGGRVIAACMCRRPFGAVGHLGQPPAATRFLAPEEPPALVHQRLEARRDDNGGGHAIPEFG